MPVWVGTSGWQYRDWRGRFYPAETPVRAWLEAFSERFATVESNNAFYRLPERRTFEDWAARTPDDFVIAVKMSRFLTHIKRLAEPEEPVRRFLGRVAGLGSKLGPVLIQLPPQLGANIDLLAATLDQFTPDIRVAVEFRHPSWFTDEVRRILEDRSVALCLADRRGVRTPMWRTADWTYLRFHEGRARPRPCYGRTALESWATRLAETWKPGEDCFAYFNNDHRACAPRDAARFAGQVDRAGLRPTRVPIVRQVRVAG
ncbi:MAG TPA: DUF72 domain-containing protein [Candidatus Limnocylindrales bacterium]|jgi:uncharacterized protein YecE (DUF72 family)|nr:DUF72 domain-containing protein [Candidatus Limnocylindrales bacterium]